MYYRKAVIAALWTPALGAGGAPGVLVTTFADTTLLAEHQATPPGPGAGGRTWSGGGVGR